MINLFFLELCNFLLSNSNAIIRILEILIPFATIHFFVNQQIALANQMSIIDPLIIWMITFWLQIFSVDMIWGEYLPINWWRLSKYGLGLCSFIRIIAFYVIYQFLPIVIIFTASYTHFNTTFYIIFFQCQITCLCVTSILGIILNNQNLSDRYIGLFLLPLIVPLSMIPFIYFFSLNALLGKQFIELSFGLLLLTLLITPKALELLINQKRIL